MIKMDGVPHLCKVDEVGELCVNANSTGISYFGLSGKTNHTFKASLVLTNLGFFILWVQQQHIIYFHHSLGAIC